MVSLAYLLTLLSVTSLVIFRLCRSYQLSFFALACGYLFIQPSIGASRHWQEHSFGAALLIVAAAYYVAQKVGVNTLTKHSTLIHRSPLAITIIFLATQLIATVIDSFFGDGISPFSSSNAVMLHGFFAIGAMLSAYGVYCHQGTRWILIFGSSLFVSTTLYALLLGYPFSRLWLMAYAGPWVWLIVMRATDSTNWMARMLIALTAATSPIIQLILPIGFLHLAALPIILAAIICLSDILRSANTQSLLIDIIPATACIAATSALVIQFSFA